jgi:transglutaminase-like putative cysteine protease
LAGVSSWVGSRLGYVAGSSRSTDGAVSTLLAGEGVCRDFAHLTIALLRAMDMPARVVSVYAPGLAPMDFHAVTEAYVQGAWQVVDATLLAPRSSMIRIATGRDCADTAFLSTYGGTVELLDSQVTATVDGQLPGDDPRTLAVLG